MRPSNRPSAAALSLRKRHRGLGSAAVGAGFIRCEDRQGSCLIADVERAQGPAPVTLDREPDDNLPAARGVAPRDRTAVRGGLVAVNPDVVASLVTVNGIAAGTVEPVASRNLIDNGGVREADGPPRLSRSTRREAGIAATCTTGRRPASRPAPRIASSHRSPRPQAGRRSRDGRRLRERHR